MDDLDKAAHSLMRDIVKSDPLLVRLGQALAPAVNKALQDRDDLRSRKVGAQMRSHKRHRDDEFCPGCGELSSWAPDLCPECLDVNAHSKEQKDG